MRFAGSLDKDFTSGQAFGFMQLWATPRYSDLAMWFMFFVLYHRIACVGIFAFVTNIQIITLSSIRCTLGRRMECLALLLHALMVVFVSASLVLLLLF